ncbi:unnamed protein product, partial [Durusdinium trenchii]
DLRYLEFFAGKGEVFTAVKAEHTAVAVDLEYLSGVGHAMDINSDSGLALAIWLVLNCREDSFVVLFATCCSSWVHINSGTSKRSLLLPEGATQLDYIVNSNKMVARCVLLFMLVVARGGTYLLEQPGSSLMRHYHRFQYWASISKVSWHNSEDMETLGPICILWHGSATCHS